MQKRRKANKQRSNEANRQKKQKKQRKKKEKGKTQKSRKAEGPEVSVQNAANTIRHGIRSAKTMQERCKIRDFRAKTAKNTGKQALPAKNTSPPRPPLQKKH